MKARSTAHSAHFGRLVDGHHDLENLLLRHQVALMRSDLTAARETFAKYEAAVGLQIADEEETLFPLYEASGGVDDIAEYGRLDDHAAARSVERLSRALDALGETIPTLDARSLIALLDMECDLKSLMKSRLARAVNYLYPALDRLLEPTTRALALRQCRFPESAETQRGRRT